MIYEISDLVLAVQGGRESMKSCMKKYALPLDSERGRALDMGIFIRYTSQIPKPKGEPCGKHLIWQMCQEDGRSVVYRTLPGFDDIVSARMDFDQDKTEIAIFSPDGEGQEMADDTRDYLFGGQAFSQMCLERQRMVLHASCIVSGGKAILFSAPSGTGKSTHTALWQKYVPDTVMLNDDTPVLRLDQEVVTACGSPWSGKSYINENISAPVGAIIFLERGQTNQICRISHAEAFGRLLGEARKLPFARSMQLAAAHCGVLLSKVPMYRLTCDISYDAVQTVREELSL